MAHEESFSALRSRLEREGKIHRDGDGYRLTPAGNAHAERLIGELAVKQEREFTGRAVRWNYQPRRQ